MIKKVLTLVLVLTVTAVAYCQKDYTTLDEKTYNTIKFDGVLFMDIKATKGDVKELNELLLNKNWIWSGKSKKPNAVTIEIYGYEFGMPQRVFNYNSGFMPFS